MAARLKRLFRLYALYARMDFQWFTQDTLFCAIVMVGDLISYASAASGMLLLAARFGGVGGMTADGVLFMMGFFMMGDGLTLMLGGFNVGMISRRVGRGQVDHMLIQPVPLWMQLLTEGFLPVSGSTGFLAGVAIVAIALSRLRLAVTPRWLLAAAGLLFLRQAIEAGVNFLSGAAAFYRPAAFEELSSLTHDALSLLGRYPLFGLPPAATAALTTILPAGLMAWLPARVLLGQAPPAAAALMAAVAAALSALAAHAFRRGLKRYAQYGSGRYRPMGHRS